MTSYLCIYIIIFENVGGLRQVEEEEECRVEALGAQRERSRSGLDS